MTTTKTTTRPATCHKCGSRDLKATSSQQFRRIAGKRRQVADVVCNACGHQWWSVHPTVRALARQADTERRENDAWHGAE